MGDASPLLVGPRTWWQMVAAGGSAREPTPEARLAPTPCRGSCSSLVGRCGRLPRGDRLEILEQPGDPVEVHLPLFNAPRSQSFAGTSMRSDSSNFRPSRRSRQEKQSHPSFGPRPVAGQTSSRTMYSSGSAAIDTPEITLKSKHALEDRAAEGGYVPHFPVMSWPYLPCQIAKLTALLAVPSHHRNRAALQYDM